MLKWARDNGCPWDEDTCAFAAEAGQLDALKWARENGCPWNSDTCEFAANAEEVEVLEWAIENGCPEYPGDYDSENENWSDDESDNWD